MPLGIDFKGGRSGAGHKFVGVVSLLGVGVGKCMAMQRRVTYAQLVTMLGLVEITRKEFSFVFYLGGDGLVVLTFFAVVPLFVMIVFFAFFFTVIVFFGIIIVAWIDDHLCRVHFVDDDEANLADPHGVRFVNHNILC